MNKIKRGMSLLLCSLLLGSVLTVGSVTDVQAGRRTVTVAKESIENINNNIEKKASEDQTSDKAEQTKVSEKGKTAQTGKIESMEAFLALPTYARESTALSEDREIGIQQIMDEANFADRNFAAAVYDSLFAADWLGEGNQSVKEVLSSYEGTIYASGYKLKITYIVTYTRVDKESFDAETIEEYFTTKEDADKRLAELQDDDKYAYREKEVKLKFEQTTEQKPEEELIKDITGIEWLRKAELIDLENNTISDLTPLSKERLKILDPSGTAGETDIAEGEKWFGVKATNVGVNILFNPIKKYPKETGGRLDISRTANKVFKLEVRPISYIKPEDNTSDKVSNINIQIPEIKQDEQRVGISNNAESAWIEESNIKGVYLDYKNFSDEIFPLKGVTSSGKLICELRPTDTMSYYTIIDNSEAAELDKPNSIELPMQFEFNQLIHIYTKVKPEPITTELTLKKTIKGTEQPVEGAVFHLYTATLAEDGTYIKGERCNNSEYTTDEKGEIQFDIELEEGTYCFVETKAPEGFLLDKTPIGFTVNGGSLKITGGEPTVTPTDGEATNAGENMTYIDRYSPDVHLQVISNAGMELDRVVVTYFDRETQKDVSKTFNQPNAVKKAEDFINAEKGDDKSVGLIDGTVKVKPILKPKATITVSNEKVIDFEFQKLSAREEKIDPEKPETYKPPMKGVRFKLKCNHKHDESCGGLNSPETCTHIHNKLMNKSDAEGCTWGLLEVSNADGKVKFKELVSGEYLLSEMKTLDGYVLPEGTWTVTVDALKEEIKVEKTDMNNDKLPEFQEDKNVFFVENEPLVLAFKKVDEKTRNALAGAEFTLYKGDESTPDSWEIVKGPVTSDEKGLIDFGIMKQGTYFLVETKAPTGYLKPVGYWKVTITATHDDNKKVAFEAKGDVPAISGSYIDGFEISNRKQSQLPAMGGNGTMVFVVSGLLIMGCAFALYLKYKRRGA